MAAIIILLCLKYASQYGGNDFLFPLKTEFPLKSRVGVLGGGGGGHAHTGWGKSLTPGPK